MSKISSHQFYFAKIKRLRERLLDVAEDCASMAKDETIAQAERRTWRLVAAKARRYAEGK